MRKSRLSLQTSSETFEMGKRRAVVIEFDPNHSDLISIRAAEKAASAERAAKRKKGGRR